jgi:aspartokinase
VISIAQGSSEYNLSLVVDERDADEAMRAIHSKFL